MTSNEPGPIQCYARQDGSIKPKPRSLPCSPINTTNPVALCCIEGSHCTTGSLCRIPGTAPPGRTGYYLASCTDPDFSDSICPQHCTNQANRDSWWNQTAEDWQCCGVDANQNSSCDNPTKETFKGPAPSDLTDLQQIATATQDLLSWQLSSTSAGPSRTGNARPKDTSGGLSTGAKAGIGVGAALGFIIILCAVCFGLYIFKKRRRARNIPEMTPVAAHGFPQEETQSHMQELEAPSKPIGMSARLPKKDNQSLMQELEAPRKPIEMPAQQDEPVELDGGTDGSSSSGHYSNFC